MYSFLVDDNNEHEEAKGVNINVAATILHNEYNIVNTNNIPHFKVKHSFVKNTFFPSVIIEWNKLDLEIQNIPSLNIFKKNNLKFIRHNANNLFGCHNLKSIKFLKGYDLGLVTSVKISSKITSKIH